MLRQFGIEATCAESGGMHSARWANTLSEVPVVREMPMVVEGHYEGIGNTLRNDARPWLASNSGLGKDFGPGRKSRGAVSASPIVSYNSVCM